MTDDPPTDDPPPGESDTVADLVDSIGARTPPLITADASLREAVAAFWAQRHTRVLYVVDDQGVLVGALTAGTLLRHVEPYGHAPQVHARRVPALLGGDTVEQIMLHHPVSVRLDDTVQDAVRSMTEAGAKELPVCDHLGRVLADITVIDALYHSLVLDPGTTPGGDNDQFQ